MNEQEKILGRLLAMNNAFREDIPLMHSVVVMRQAYERGDLFQLAETFMGLTQEEQQAIWVRPTKGGVMSGAMMDYIKSTEFADLMR